MNYPILRKELMKTAWLDECEILIKSQKKIPIGFKNKE